MRAAVPRLTVRFKLVKAPELKLYQTSLYTPGRSHGGSGYGSSDAPIVVPLVKLQLAAGVKAVAFAHRLLAGTVTAPATYR